MRASFLRTILAGLALASSGASAAVPAGRFPVPPSWSEPIAPFRTVGPIYYVGTKGLAAYLIRTSAGLILIDGTLAETAPQVERNIQALGFRLSEVRLLLNSHAHFDHAAGLAQLKRDTGATLLASPGDAPALQSGRPPSVMDYGLMAFPPVKVDRLLVDGQPVRLGDTALVPVFTPGHTPGCTSWSLRSTERGRPIRVVFPCSLTVAGNQLIGNPGYPAIVGDFRRSFRRLIHMQADVVLPAHPELADVLGRARRRDAGEADAFLSPGLLQKLDADAAQAFEADLGKARMAQH